jgi:O-antigen/teichoic acid export membrane protein
VRRGAKFYFAANLTAQLSALLRYVILARLLGPTEFGLAATLILTAAFFESVSDTGADRFLIQDKEGDQPAMLGLVHGVQAARGLLIAAGLALSAGLIATLYQQPELEFSLMALAAAPLIAGFVHLDLRRVQRNGDFRPESWSMMIAEPLALVATGIAAWILRDHTAVIYGLVTRSIAVVLVSHLTTRHPYRYNWLRSHAWTFGAFAAPLAINGVLLFLGTQGDRVVVSSLGPTILGHYTAVLMLVYYPTAMFGRFLVNFHLPILSRSRIIKSSFAISCSRYSIRVLVIGLIFLLGYTILAPYVVPIIFGSSFSQSIEIYALLAALQCSRFIRIWPTGMALSLGRSDNILIANIVRLSAIPLSLISLAEFQSLEYVLAIFVVSEFVALAVALLFLRLSGMIAFWHAMARGGLFATAALTICLAAWAHENGYTVAAWAAVSAALAASGTLAALDRKYLSEDILRVLARLKR